MSNSTTPDKRKALGRGLESLLPSSRATAAPQADLAGPNEEVSIDLIDRNPYQTRTQLNEAALAELAESISANGVIQPVAVRRIGDRFQLIAGERRWAASKLAGKQTIPCVVLNVSNQQAMEITIVENLQREDLNPMEQSRAYERLSREFGLTHEQMAQRTGKDRASVSNFLRLLKLPVEVQDKVLANELTFGHAKVLLALSSPEQILKVAQDVSRLSLSVRQTEDLVSRTLNPEKPSEPKSKKVEDPNVREAERELQRSLGVKVKILDRKGKGKVIIEYSSLEDFDRICERLGPAS